MPARSTGCMTCRIRKIKCDEAVPSCRKCSSTGRKCDGYSALLFSRDELLAANRSSVHGHSSLIAIPAGQSAALIPRLVSNGTFKTAAEKRYFHFFRHCTVAATNLTSDSCFWDRLILQASEAEPAIKHAVLAIAAFHNSTIEREAHIMARHHLAYAERQYQQALGHARNLISKVSSQRTIRVLMVCMLFIIYEGLRGNYTVSQLHMDSGRSIVAQCRYSEQRISYRRYFSEILAVFARLDVFAISFSDDAAPYRNTLADMLGTSPNYMSCRFETLYEAQVSLIDHLRWILILDNHINHSQDSEGVTAVEPEMSCEKCTESLVNWRQCWDRLRTSHTYADSLQVQNIELWYYKAHAILNAGFSGAETRYDHSHNSFLRIVEISEDFSACLSKNKHLASFSLDLGLIVPVFFCAIRCRDPHIRRRAIAVLERRRRREGTWESTVAAAVAKRWVSLEEEGLGIIKRAEQVPVDNRVAVVRTQVNVDDSVAILRFFKSGPAGGAVLLEEQTLQWETAIP